MRSSVRPRLPARVNVVAFNEGDKPTRSDNVHGLSSPYDIALTQVTASIQGLVAILVPGRAWGMYACRRMWDPIASAQFLETKYGCSALSAAMCPHAVCMMSWTWTDLRLL